jgi:hypothetical protein
MLKRHEDQIWGRLDQLYANGTTFISWGELYHWYNIEEKGQSKGDPQVSIEGRAGVSLFFARKIENLSKLAA